MHTLLTEFIEPKMRISTPFLAYLGQVPVQVFAILERTAIIQIIGEDQRRVVRHDLIFVEEGQGEKWKIRKRPADVIELALKEARDRGRMNRRNIEQFLNS
jgi:hypothetical protein